MSLSIALPLQKRGYLISIKNNQLYLSTGSHQDDQSEITKLLNRLEISHAWKGQYLLVNEDSITVEQIKRIQWDPPRNHESHTPMYFGKWKQFVKRMHGPKINVKTLDPGVAALVKAMSAAGIITANCCEGHGRFYPRVEFAGIQNAIWFEILQEKFFAFTDSQLYYDWRVTYEKEFSYIRCEFKAVRHINEREPWDLSAIQDDTFKIAQTLHAHAEEIITLKKQVFGNDSIKTNKRLVSSMSVTELRDFMVEQFMLKGK
ncbi:hypothetical protein [Neobacillus drentensis]|uniref:hypothetical protein n=1 Tax=Neobacillus drentensis TaxID=220684 RepID=UPI0030004667